jgi:hypothetical protein
MVLRATGRPSWIQLGSIGAARSSPEVTDGIIAVVDTASSLKRSPPKRGAGSARENALMTKGADVRDHSGSAELIGNHGSDRMTSRLCGYD